MIKKFPLLFLIVFACIANQSHAQHSKIDSLLTLIKKCKEDTSKVNHLNKLSVAYQSIGYYDSSTSLATTAFILSTQLNFKRGIALACNSLGNINREQGNYSHALDYFIKALKINKELKDKSRIASTLGNIGIVYLNKGDYPKALDYYFKALTVAEELGDKNLIALWLGNIGIVYTDQDDYVKALDYYLKALKIVEELGNRNKIAIWLVNIGVVYSKQSGIEKSKSTNDSLFAKAIDYYLKALNIGEELGDKNSTATILANIGTVYANQGESEKSKKQSDSLLTKALDYYLNALKICEELGDKDRVAVLLSNISSLYSEQEKYQEACNYLYRALTLSDSLGAKNHVKECYNNLSDLYEKSNILLPDSIGGKLLNTEQMRLRALYYHKRYIAVRDTLFSEENKKQLVRKEMNFEFEKKETVTKAEYEADKKQKKIVIWSVFGGLLLVVVFAGFIFRSLRITNKQKQIIEQQKALVEEHQKDIIDSITYAKRLQEAILPPLDFVKKHLPDTFILYKPKDIVAGDFYWMEVMDNTVFIASADCTGHGVPGAMVSVVCSNALNRTVKEFGLRDTGKILDKVTELVLETFEKSDKDVKDGMDISLLAINQSTKQIQWSGANNPLWYIQNGELIDITANKQPIGKHDNRVPFTVHSIVYVPNTIFYLFTDGYADQFGGAKGKKFKYKQLEEKLLLFSNKPLEEQKNLLGNTFDEWKGDLEQVDDVCIIGIKT